MNMVIDPFKLEDVPAVVARYLAEAVWYPTALLPSDTLVWTPIDDIKTLTTLT